MKTVIELLCATVFPKLLLSMAGYLAFVLAACAASAVFPIVRDRFHTSLAKSLPLLLIAAAVSILR